MASGCSAWIISDRRPATGPDRSVLSRQVTLPGPKKPSSAGCSGTLAAYAAAERSTSPDTSAYESAATVDTSGRNGKVTAPTYPVVSRSDARGWRIRHGPGGAGRRAGGDPAAAGRAGARVR